MTNQLKLAVCALTAILITGCGEATYPVWLPDSSGFLVPRSDGSVVHYDIGKDATRQIIEPGFHGPGRVAINPRGDKIAIATAWVGDNCQAVGVEIATWPERKRLVLKKEEFGVGTDDHSQPTYGYCYWSPDGAKVLICYSSRYESILVRFAIYDLETDELVAPISTTPAFSICSAIGVSPVVPDGSGYIASAQHGAQVRFLLVDWEGWEREISITPEAQRLADVLVTKRFDQDAKNRLRYPLPPARWEKNQLICPTRGLPRS